MAPPPSAPIYRNVLTHEKETQHPLRHVYARLAKRQAKLIFQRKKPDAMSPEAWMEFVGSGGAPYYYCFVNGRMEYDFPPLFPIGAVGVAIKDAEERHANRLRMRMMQKPKRRLSPGSLEAMRVNMEAEQKSKPRRAALLKKMPLPLTHIVFCAQYLGIDTLTQTHLMWLASAALCDTLSPTLPVGWERRKTVEGSEEGSVPPGPKPLLSYYYYNPSLRTSQWEHPSLTHWRSVLTELLSFERKTLGNDEAHMGLGAQDYRPPGDPKGGNGKPPKQMLWVTQKNVG